MGFRWKWSDNASHWNQSIQPIFHEEPSNSSCANMPCHVDMCTLLTNSSKFLIGERCNVSHPFICMIGIGKSSNSHWVLSSVFVSLMIQILTPILIPSGKI